MADPAALSALRGDTASGILLSRLSEFVAGRMGLNFPRERWRDLERGIISAAREFGFVDLSSCAEWLLNARLTRNELEILASHLTVGETYFFRDRKCFRILQEHILPELMRARRKKERCLRVWSAGCATGEEPYSIAILLNEMLADIDDWTITILATDINPRFLKRAVEGAYTDWSFREAPLSLKEKYFRKKDKGFLEVVPEIRKMVTFLYHNLVEDAYPSLLNNTNAMDIIFCRNVSMYFSGGRALEVLRNLCRCLVDGGWLIVSPVEASLLPSAQVKAVNLDGAIFYRKEPWAPEQHFRVEAPPLYEGGETPQWPASAVVYAPPVPEIMQGKGAEEAVLEAGKQAAGAQPYEEALALYEQGRYEEAGNGLVRLLSSDRAHAGAMALLSRVCANQGRLDDALMWGGKAVSSDKCNPEFHYLVASVLQEMGRSEEAVAALKRALYLNQGFVLAHFALGNMRRQQGRARESRKHFENARSLLNSYRRDDVLSESEGMTAGRLIEIIEAIRKTGAEAAA